MKAFRPFLLIVIACSAGLLFVQGRAVDAGDVRAEILDLTNSAREIKNLKPLVMNEDLNAIAQKHSERMATKKVAFGHIGFQQRYEAARKAIPGINATGENVAFGPDSPGEIVDGWMHSKGHRENILGSFSLIGIGVAKGSDGSWYYTQFFCTR